MYPFFTDILRREGACEAVRFAKECGFSAIEILEGVRPGSRPLFETPEAALELRRELDRGGLRCACYSVSINILSDELGPEHTLSGDAALRACADSAKALGSPFLHHTLTIGYVPPSDREDTIDTILPSLLERAGRVADYCASLGLTVLYEPQGNYVNGLDGFPRFYDEMKRRGYRVGVCGDTGNCLYVGGDPVAFFARYAADIRHVHVKDLLPESDALNRYNAPRSRRWDPIRDGSLITEAYLGEGVVDLDGCVRELSRVGYDGVCSLETFYWNTLTVSLRDHYRRDRAYMLEHYAT